MSGSRVFVRQVVTLLVKDLRTEWRTREIFTLMFVFTALVVVVFNFAIGADGDLIRKVAAGVMWVALIFATVLGLQRAGQTEHEEDSLQGVLLALGDRSALFLAKALAQMCYLAVVALCIVPLCSVWFHLDFLPCLVELSVVFLLGIVGLSLIGTLLAMLVMQVRASEVMLPLLFLPVSVPLTIATVYATAQLINGKSWRDIADYLILLGVFDVVFLVVALLVFDYVVED